MFVAFKDAETKQLHFDLPRCHFVWEVGGWGKSHSQGDVCLGHPNPILRMGDVWHVFFSEKTDPFG